MTFSCHPPPLPAEHRTAGKLVIHRRQVGGPFRGLWQLDGLAASVACSSNPVPVPSANVVLGQVCRRRARLCTQPWSITMCPRPRSSGCCCGPIGVTARLGRGSVDLGLVPCPLSLVPCPLALDTPASRTGRPGTSTQRVSLTFSRAEFERRGRWLRRGFVAA